MGLFHRYIVYIFDTFLKLFHFSRFSWIARNLEMKGLYFSYLLLLGRRDGTVHVNDNILSPVVHVSCTCSVS